MLQTHQAINPNSYTLGSIGDVLCRCRLQQAGAVLVAKLATGEMAFDDVWWGGKVKNPWNLEEGSSGSSAGPAAAVVAGAVPFAVRGMTTCIKRPIAFAATWCLSTCASTLSACLLHTSAA